ncbi:hypothetical protein PPACK8108_LOCUS16557 [Phakopsora pachyrhizi]|uniref:Uncharacterized protein n=1 Tax=Phakopsora pachyrhizi TaxID=170000 RepID=A0AAV0BB73_PHAPC|nr:hypothetical protein PPACK8108_LOCUS16557 [Phakopsora pachyrhizi]
MDLTQLLTPIKLTNSFLMQLLTWLPDWTVLLPHSHQGLLVLSQLPNWLPGYLYNYQHLYLSTASLGISQRAIVSAVGGARAIHLSSAASPPTGLDSLNSSYLDLLDRCTNVGIYVVHHLFTLAELFTLAGMNLTHTAVSTSFYTVVIAQQLVETINGDGGDVSIKEFSEYWPIVKRALKSNYLNQTFYTTHAPSSGPLLIYLLNILKNYQMTGTNQSPLSEHWFLEALKYTAAACTILGDPNFLNKTEILQFKKFTSKSFANQVFKKIDDKLHTTQKVVLSNETVYLDGFSHSKPGSGKYLGASLGLSARAVAGKTQHLQSVTDARKASSSFGSVGLPQLSTLQMQKARLSSLSLNPGRIGVPFEQTSLTGSRNAMKPSLSSKMEESGPAQLFSMPNLNSLSPPTIGLERQPAFHCRHILSVQQFTRQDLHALFSVAQEMVLRSKSKDLSLSFKVLFPVCNLLAYLPTTVFKNCLPILSCTSKTAPSDSSSLKSIGLGTMSQTVKDSQNDFLDL